MIGWKIDGKLKDLCINEYLSISMFLVQGTFLAIFYVHVSGIIQISSFQALVARLQDYPQVSLLHPQHQDQVRISLLSPI